MGSSHRLGVGVSLRRQMYGLGGMCVEACLSVYVEQALVCGGHGVRYCKFQGISSVIGCHALGAPCVGRAA